MSGQATLDEIARDPTCVTALPAPVRQQLAARCAAVQAALANVPLEEAANGDRPDRLIDLDKAARMLDIAPTTLRKKDVPFRVKIDGAVRYSLLGIERYITARQGR